MRDWWTNNGASMCAFLASAPPPNPDSPSTYKLAMESPYKADWIKAMKEEMDSLKRLGTYTIVRLPPGRQAISSKWVYKIKRDDKGNIVRFKARLVAIGCSQVKGKDFQETFAPVARMASQRMVISIAALEGLTLHTIDVDNAYLNGVIDTRIFMKQPRGFVEPNYQDTKVWVCELNKGLYGLKQAGNIWNAAIHAYILELGFKRTFADLCVYLTQHQGQPVYFALHVNDFLVAAPLAQFTWFASQLAKRFSIKSKPADMCLGLKIDKIPGRGYSFGQQHS